MFGHECPVRISHDPVNRMYGVAIVKTVAPPMDDSRPEPPVSSLRLLDDISFERMSL